METKIGDLITTKVSDYHKSLRNEPEVLYIDQSLWMELIHELADSGYGRFTGMYKGLKVILVKEDGWCEVA